MTTRISVTVDRDINAGNYEVPSFMVTVEGDNELDLYRRVGKALSGDIAAHAGGKLLVQADSGEAVVPAVIDALTELRDHLAELLAEQNVGQCEGCGNVHADPLTKDEMADVVTKMRGDFGLMHKVAKLANDERLPEDERATAKRLVDEAMAPYADDDSTVKDETDETAEAKPLADFGVDFDQPAPGPSVAKLDQLSRDFGHVPAPRTVADAELLVDHAPLPRVFEE